MISHYSSQIEAKEHVHEVLSKIVTSVQDGSSELRSLLEPLLTARHPVQIYQCLTEGVLLFLILLILWYKPRRPGVVAATFLVLYSGMRIFLENYRMPDPTMGYDAFGLVRTQWLAIISLIIGFIMLFVWGRRETLPSPGWGRGQNVKLHRR
jgi:phosphatidylglycerol:prolipoprotein diacylglycerol transferase